MADIISKKRIINRLLGRKVFTNQTAFTIANLLGQLVEDGEEFDLNKILKEGFEIDR